jgi:outer membrane protein assembly factor BamB
MRLSGLSAALLVISVVIAGLSLGCGSSKQDLAAKGQPAVTPSFGGAGFPLPAPDAVLAGLDQPRGASAAVLIRSGSDFVPGDAQRAAAEGSNARFTPAWLNNTSAFDTLAYAIYQFNLVGVTDATALELAWASAPDDFAHLWVGLSRWGDGCWEWFAGPADGSLELGAGGCTPYSKPVTADMLVAVVLLGTREAVLQQVEVQGTLPTGPGDWWMLGREPLHQRRSSFNGPDSATQLWAFATAWGGVGSPVIGADGTVYVGGGVKYLYAINPNGTQKWAFPTGNRVGSSSPAIGADGTVYMGGHDGNLYAINSDGTQKWTFPTASWVLSSPAIGTDGTAHVGCNDKNLYAINPDGTQKWAFPTGAQVTTNSPAIGPDGTVYMGSGKKVFAVKPDGTQEWVFPVASWIYCDAAIGADGTVYVGCDDNKLYAITDAGDHAVQKWAFATGSWVTSSPAIGADGTVYVGSDNYKLYAIGPGGP